MPAPLQKIETNPTLPDSADAVVIGGGIVGALWRITSCAAASRSPCWRKA